MKREESKNSWIEVIRYSDRVPGHVHHKELSNGQIRSEYIGKELSPATVLYLKIARERKVPIKLRVTNEPSNEKIC